MQVENTETRTDSSRLVRLVRQEISLGILGKARLSMLRDARACGSPQWDEVQG